MKTLPRWAIVAIVLGIIGIAIAAVGQFGKKSTVYVTGEVELDPSLNEAAKGIRALFIILHDEGSPMPMPYGAVRYNLNSDASGAFLSFVVTRDNLQRMDPNRMDLPKSLRVKARLDRDGSAGMDASGDIVGEVKGLTPGSQVTLRLTKLIP